MWKDKKKTRSLWGACPGLVSKGIFISNEPAHKIKNLYEGFKLSKYNQIEIEMRIWNSSVCLWNFSVLKQVEVPNFKIINNIQLTLFISLQNMVRYEKHICLIDSWHKLARIKISHISF